MLMKSPYSRKAVDVPDGLVDRYRGAGFIEQEPEVTEPKAPRRKRTSSK